MTTYYFFNEIDSTNDFAKRLVRHSATWNPSVIVAGTQTKGRGQHHRQWVSDKGGLFFSILFKPTHFDFNQVNQVPLRIANAVSQMIDKLTAIPTIVKAPNDIMFQDQKLGGVLIETASHFSLKVPRYMIVGVGLNINQVDFPPFIRKYTTSLKQITNQTYAIMPFIVELEQRIYV